MAKRTNAAKALRRKQSQIDNYMQKIKEIEQQKRELEDEFALQVGQTVLKKLDNDMDKVDTFYEWLDLYLLEQAEQSTKVDESTDESNTNDYDEPVESDGDYV